MDYNETIIQRYIEKNWSKLFPYWTYLGSQFSICGLFSRKSIGRADFAFRCSKGMYVAELKYANGRNNSLFWDSLKVAGYAQAHSMLMNRKIKPAVFINKDWVTNDTRPILYKLGIDYVTIKRENDGLFFEYDFN